MFRVGRIVSRNGELSWRSIQDEKDDMNKTFT
jgi:hypothetical protein